MAAEESARSALVAGSHAACAVPPWVTALEPPVTDGPSARAATVARARTMTSVVGRNQIFMGDLFLLVYCSNSRGSPGRPCDLESFVHGRSRRARELEPLLIIRSCRR